MRLAFIVALSMSLQACAHRNVSWMERPAPVAGIGASSLELVVDGPDCGPLAQDLAHELAVERGLSLGEQAPSTLVLESCQSSVLARLEREDQPPVALEALAVHPKDLRRAAQSEEPTPVSPRLRRELARDLAQQVAPMPTRQERRLYRRAAPGSAQALHNEAVMAEQDGRLDAALEHARAAYIAKPCWSALAYVRDLEHQRQRLQGLVDAED